MEHITGPESNGIVSSNAVPEMVTSERRLLDQLTYDLAHYPDQTIVELATVLGGFFVAHPEQLEPSQEQLKESIRYLGNPAEYMADFNEHFNPQLGEE